jgi:hypothetical protein
MIKLKMAESHESVFGLATTPISFILTPQVLISLREQGNKAVESYIQRIQMIMENFEEQNKPVNYQVHL